MAALTVLYGDARLAGPARSQHRQPAGHRTIVPVWWSRHVKSGCGPSPHLTTALCRGSAPTGPDQVVGYIDGSRAQHIKGDSPSGRIARKSVSTTFHYQKELWTRQQSTLPSANAERHVGRGKRQHKHLVANTPPAPPYSRPSMHALQSQLRQGNQASHMRIQSEQGIRSEGTGNANKGNGSGSAQGRGRPRPGMEHASTVMDVSGMSKDQQEANAKVHFGP
ncbi:hypothetical protein MRB53_042267 [Persea americana]|nr:hypothetical protein MRB53_042267 [Persea americana]